MVVGKDLAKHLMQMVVVVDVVVVVVVFVVLDAIIIIMIMSSHRWQQLQAIPHALSAPRCL